jgi:hypothetical protein
MQESSMQLPNAPFLFKNSDEKTANQVSNKEDVKYGLFNARIPTQANASQDNR